MNIELTNLLGIPHSSCDNHNLNLDIEDMQNNDQVLCELLEEVSRVLSYVRRSFNKSSILRQFTNIRSVTACNTSWIGSLICISLYLKFFQGLIPLLMKKSLMIWIKHLRHRIFVSSKTNWRSKIYWWCQCCTSDMRLYICTRLWCTWYY